LPTFGLKELIVLALHSTAHPDTPFAAKPVSEAPLSTRASMAWIAALSAFGWAVLLLPFWTVVH
jgi:hypothetical protein